MKRLFTLLIAVVLAASVFAQAPQKMSYQAVIRNSSNALVTSSPVGMRVSILQGSQTGTEIYKEIFNPNPETNANGLVTIEIGGGIPLSGTFESINWSTGPYFIKTETDPTGGTNYTITGTSQLLSVPYALYAKTVTSFSETDPVFSASPADGISSTNINNWNTAYDWGNHAAAEYAPAVHLHSNATISSSGFMSAADKTKINGLQNADGSETIITGGTNVAIEGTGTSLNPYIINANSGSTFIRYGASTSPAGATLIYSGYVYGGLYNHGKTDPVVLKSGDPGSEITATEGLILPICLGGSTITGITNGTYLSGAVCFIEFPTATIWGTHSVPDGWTLLYKGYAYGAHYTYSGSIIGPICIDADNFQVNSTMSSPNPIAPVKLYQVAPGDVINSCIKCMVIYKE